MYRPMNIPFRLKQSNLDTGRLTSESSVLRVLTSMTTLWVRRRKVIPLFGLHTCEQTVGIRIF